jgi:hypothetical protein
MVPETYAHVDIGITTNLRTAYTQLYTPYSGGNDEL